MTHQQVRAHMTGRQCHWGMTGRYCQNNLWLDKAQVPMLPRQDAMSMLHSFDSTYSTHSSPNVTHVS
jgi:hypothetical protein